MTKYLFLILYSFLGSHAYGSETTLFRCSSSSSEFQSVVVSEIVANAGGTITATLRLVATDNHSRQRIYWQNGDVTIGSDDTLVGPFLGDARILVSLRAPTYPNYKPRDSTITVGSVVIHLACAD